MLTPATAHDLITAVLLSPLLLLLPQFRGPRLGVSPARRAFESLRKH